MTILAGIEKTTIAVNSKQVQNGNERVQKSVLCRPVILVWFKLVVLNYFQTVALALYETSTTDIKGMKR